MTGKSLVLERFDGAGKKGVNTFKKRQSSDPWLEALFPWAHADPKLRAEISDGPVYAEEYVNR